MAGNLGESAGEQEELPWIIAARHTCVALKAKESLISWNVEQLRLKLLSAGPDTPPQRQYKYPTKAEPGLHKTINALIEQGVVTETQRVVWQGGVCRLYLPCRARSGLA